ncbi:MAG: hypothetical protein ACRD13_09035 [Terriglobales bacterium]
MRKTLPLLLGVALAATLVIDLALYRQNGRLKARVASGGSLRPPVGAMMPPLRGLDTAGKPLSVSFGVDKRQTILFVFAADCEVCSRTWPMWRSWLRRIDRRAFRPIFASMGARIGAAVPTINGTAGYQEFAELDPSVVASYNLRLTPEVLILSPSGRLESAWLGEIEGRQLAEIQSLIGIPLNTNLERN